MKSLCIIGSPRDNGSTAYIVDKIIEGMKDSGIKTKRYCLGKQTIKYCLGCKECYKDGTCIQKDDMDLIIEDFKENSVTDEETKLPDLSDYSLWENN